MHFHVHAICNACACTVGRNENISRASVLAGGQSLAGAGKQAYTRRLKHPCKEMCCCEPNSSWGGIVESKSSVGAHDNNIEEWGEIDSCSEQSLTSEAVGQTVHKPECNEKRRYGNKFFNGPHG